VEDKVYSKLGTIIVIVIAIFPFAAVLANLATSESAITAIVVAAIMAVFFLVILIASRITIEPETELAAAAPRQPAPPIEWSWDGTNRQPDQDSNDDDNARAEVQR
jgi:hypothetical protein